MSSQEITKIILIPSCKFMNQVAFILHDLLPNARYKQDKCKWL